MQKRMGRTHALHVAVFRPFDAIRNASLAFCFQASFSLYFARSLLTSCARRYDDMPCRLYSCRDSYISTVYKGNPYFELAIPSPFSTIAPVCVKSSIAGILDCSSRKR